MKTQSTNLFAKQVQLFLFILHLCFVFTIKSLQWNWTCHPNAERSLTKYYKTASKKSRVYTWTPHLIEKICLFSSEFTLWTQVRDLKTSRAKIISHLWPLWSRTVLKPEARQTSSISKALWERTLAGVTEQSTTPQVHHLRDKGVCILGIVRNRLFVWVPCKCKDSS